MNSEIYYSAVVPVFNESGNLKVLHSRLNAVMQGLGRPYELIFVDDGSSDDSVTILKELQATNPHLRVICFLRNFGQHPAVMAGFASVRGQVVVTLDADLQNPPEEIPKLVRALEDGYDIASGWRKLRHDPLARKIPSLFVNKMIGRLTGVYLNDYGCMLRAYKRPVVEYLKLFPEHSKFITALSSWLKVKIIEVPVDQSARQAGSSKYNYAKLIRMNFDLLTGFSSTPIQCVSAAGLLMSFFGFAFGFWLLIFRLIYGPTALGLSSFVAVVLVMGGVQLLALGMIGEYVGRMFVQVQGRPYYIVKETFESVEAQVPAKQEGTSLPQAALQSQFTSKV